MRTSRCFKKVSWGLAGLCVAILFAGSIGCNSRIMTIHRGEVINTYVEPQGSPLSIDIVTVAPADFKGDEKENANHDLLPDGGITADVWFKRKPTRLSMADEKGVEHFILDRKQIISFTDNKKQDVYGVRQDGRIRGRRFEKADRIIVEDIPAMDIRNRKSAIYVFGKFMDAEGNVIPTKPVIFSPVDAYHQRIEIEIDKEGIYRISKPTYGAGRAVEGSVR